MSGSAQRSPDFRGMMSIIINHGDAVELAFALKPAVRAGKGEQSLVHGRIIGLQQIGGGQGSHGVGNVMLAGNHQIKMAQAGLSPHQIKTAESQFVVCNIGGTVVAVLFP